MNKKLSNLLNTSSIFFILVFCLTLVSPLVSAVPPVTQISSPEYLNIVFPVHSYFKTNPDGFDLHFHVYNSTGQVLNNSNVACNYHLYNSSNNHLSDDVNLSQDSNGVDLKIVINSTIATTIGSYSYIISCSGYNGQTESGWLENQFFITTNGLPKEQYTTDFSLGIIIILPMLFAGFVLFGAFALGDEHNILRIFLFMLGSLMILLSFHFALLTVINVYGFVELEETISTTAYWMAWTLGAIIMYFIIYIIYTIFDSIGKQKQQKLEY